jgi:hypothetical protein
MVTPRGADPAVSERASRTAFGSGRASRRPDRRLSPSGVPGAVPPHDARTQGNEGASARAGEEVLERQEDRRFGEHAAPTPRVNRR